MSKRPRRWSSPLVAGVVALVIAGPATAAAAPSCAGGRPTATGAWRAFVPAGTPLRPRPHASAHHAPLSTVDRWLLVLGRAHDRRRGCLLGVRSPQRPNTAHTWVARDRVALKRTSWRIEVSRARRTVVLRHRGHAIRRWSAVVGAPSTPTPTGTFAVLDSFRSPAGSFYGRWILLLTAHSTVLDSFNGGDGRTGLHGRGGASLLDPLGTARSHGCIRLDDRAVAAIIRRVGRARLPGVPVIVR